MSCNGKRRCFTESSLVSELSDGNYLLLDGAHRMKAMMALGCKRVAVQVVPDEK
ncbi:ParB N-terminal domain-containing protein [Bacillus thuringiensis]|nr:ParB N-terminal domain-containing protein [Bacillus thuringiensis]